MIKVTLQLPVQVHGGSVELFLREAELRKMPEVGSWLRGWGLPQINGAPPGWGTIIRRVLEDEHDGILVFCQGFVNEAYTAEEMPAQLGPGWRKSSASLGGTEPEGEFCPDPTSG